MTTIPSSSVVRQIKTYCSLVKGRDCYGSSKYQQRQFVVISTERVRNREYRLNAVCQKSTFQSSSSKCVVFHQRRYLGVPPPSSTTDFTIIEKNNNESTTDGTGTNMFEHKNASDGDDEVKPVTKKKKKKKKKTNNKKHFITIDRSKFTVAIPMKLPDLGEDGGTIVKWYKKEGDLIRYEDLLCDIQSEQLSFGMASDDECNAIMGNILVPVSEEPIKSGTEMCILLYDEKDAAMMEDGEE